MPLLQKCLHTRTLCFTSQKSLENQSKRFDLILKLFITSLTLFALYFNKIMICEKLLAVKDGWRC